MHLDTFILPFVPYHHRENILNERFDRKFMDAPGELLLTADLPDKYCADAVLDTTFIYNLIP